MIKLRTGSRGCVLACAGVLFAMLGCGSSHTSTEKPATPPPQAEVQPLPAEDPELLANLSIADQSANEMMVPEEKADEGVQLLAASVQPAKADYRRPFLATVRVEHGGKVTTGSVIHCSPEHGVFILTCRHGREAGGPWVARCSGGALIYGEKYVTRSSFKTVA